MKKVLIAHQSTIPHYRVPFYNAMELMHPESWQFDVVFDPRSAERFFKEPLDVTQFKFSIAEVSTYSLEVFGKRISYQNFWRRASDYDLVIVENAVNNLTYPLCHLHQLFGIKIAYWGHGKDRSIETPSLFKTVSEKVKLSLVKRADGFFAYTEEVKRYLQRQGVSADKIFVLNNTIDIDEQHRTFIELVSQKSALKQKFEVAEKRVLLFVGRFTENKRIDFLLKAFSHLCEKDQDFHLFLVGSGGEPYLSDLDQSVLDNVSYFGSVIALDKLAPIYVASDIFTFPGAVGLGPLQALCYDLPVITMDSPTHMPEIAYLSSINAMVLKASTTPEEYAQVITSLFNTPSRLDTLRDGIWDSIKHLTLENMAQNFIDGVNTLLGL